MERAQRGHSGHGDPAGSPRPVATSLLEAGALISFATVQLMGWHNIGWQELVAGHPLLSLLVIGKIGLVAWMAADFSSGLAHYCADNWGNEDTPLIGKALILPFREHHQDPMAMLENGFLERNGNSALISLPTIFWIPFFELNPFLRGLAMGLLMMTMWVLLTNQIHAWAHEENAPSWVKRFQSWGVLLSPEHHRIHHAPFDLASGSAGPEHSMNSGGHYCITSGACDRLATKVQRWTRSRRAVSSSASCE